LCALISAISGVPIEQRFAVTGSINQHGEVQPIGGVNEKIEGYFDICAARGLDGSHAVIVPRANAEHLMLAATVLRAVEAGKFRVYAVETVDQALELLTSTPAGVADGQGRFPRDSVNGRVETELAALTESVRRHALPTAEVRA
jgi:predicted ATP-dependent protease